MEFEFKHTTLPNGLTIVAELNRHAQSVAVGFYVKTGSRDEAPEEHGVSHFLEHMAFKGTARRSCEEINREFDEIGANYNAYTSEDVTAFWAAMLPEYLPQGVDLLADLLQPALGEEDFETEKQVILEEIHMYADQPAWLIYDKAMQAHFAGHPLSRNVLGTLESITALTVEQMRAYHRRRYVPGNILVAAAGRLDWNHFVELVDRWCGSWKPAPCGRVFQKHVPHQTVNVLYDERVNHGHVLCLSEAPPAAAAQKMTAEVVAVAVGDEAGSRLFWDLVDPGYADTAEMDLHQFDDAGVFCTYLSCLPDRVGENLRRVLKAFQKVQQEGLDEVELRQIQRKGAARLVLAAERPTGRLSSLASAWLYRSEYRPLEQDLQELAAQTLADVRQLLQDYPLLPQTIYALGPREEKSLQSVLEETCAELSF
jgi:predicted Zn-dependent peptidase